MDRIKTKEWYKTIDPNAQLIVVATSRVQNTLSYILLK